MAEESVAKRDFWREVSLDAFSFATLSFFYPNSIESCSPQGLTLFSKIDQRWPGNKVRFLHGRPPLVFSHKSSWKRRYHICIARLLWKATFKVCSCNSLPEKDLLPKNSTNALEGRFSVKRGANLTNNRPILQVYHLIWNLLHAREIHPKKVWTRTLFGLSRWFLKPCGKNTLKLAEQKERSEASLR